MPAGNSSCLGLHIYLSNVHNSIQCQLVLILRCRDTFLHTRALRDMTGSPGPNVQTSQTTNVMTPQSPPPSCPPPWFVYNDMLNTIPPPVPPGCPPPSPPPPSPPNVIGGCAGVAVTERAQCCLLNPRSLGCPYPPVVPPPPPVIPVVVVVGSATQESVSPSPSPAPGPAPEMEVVP